MKNRFSRNEFLTDEFYRQPASMSKKEKFKTRLAAPRSRFGWVDDRHAGGGGFHCAHCGLFVSTDVLLSGVNNRNHCPHCLWSRHLDLQASGDRLAACKAPMRPVGLALKKTRKKYSREKDGELMLIHLCVECGRASVNRLAADDDPEVLLKIFAATPQLDWETKAGLERARIEMLPADEIDLVQAQLRGSVV